MNELASKRRGSVSVLMAIGAVPLLISVGIATDYSTSMSAHAALQASVDAAALAGANAYTTSGQTTAAQAAAQKYFNTYSAGHNITVTGITITPSTTPQAYNGVNFNTVQVTVQANVKTMLLQLISKNQVNFQASAIAGLVPTGLSPQALCGVATGCPSQLATSSVKSSALDFNSIYMYGVPSDGNGGWSFSSLPQGRANYWQVGSNCNSFVDAAWTSQSRCNTAVGATVPTTQPAVMPLASADQPIAMVFVNQNNGQSASGSNGYGNNQYGAKPGYMDAFFTALYQLGPQSVSADTDNSVSLLNYAFGISLPSQSTAYSSTYNTKKTQTLSNCALQIVQVLDPTNPPTSPPYPGQCLAPNDPKSGYQYANLSCNQIAGRTFMYWWNDMGAPTDDLDYKNMSYMITCKPGVTNSDAGTIAGNNVPTYLVAALLK